MLGVALKAGTSGKHLVGRYPLALDADEARSARSQRAGLVEGEQPRAGKNL